ncbi:MAG: hypothetical protein ACJAXW_003570 [Candidatus Azotimanducaceae bacterium]
MNRAKIVTAEIGQTKKTIPQCRVLMKVHGAEAAILACFAKIEFTEASMFLAAEKFRGPAKTLVGYRLITAFIFLFF